MINDIDHNRNSKIIYNYAHIIYVIYTVVAVMFFVSMIILAILSIIDLKILYTIIAVICLFFSVVIYFSGLVFKGFICGYSIIVKNSEDAIKERAK